MLNKKLKIMFFDIETSPFLVHTFSIGRKISIFHNQIKKGSRSDIICICWKWADSNKVESLDWGLKEQNSKKMVEAFVKEIEKADLIIAQNGIRFDVKQINTHRLLHNLPPIVWPDIEDTLVQFKKYFYLPSYKLDYIGSLLAGQSKDKMELDDWLKVTENKSGRALRKMVKYCKNDVLVLEKIFNKAKTFFKPKTNAGIILGNGRYACPRCGCKDSYSNGYRVTLARRYQRLVCKECRHTFQGPSS